MDYRERRYYLVRLNDGLSPFWWVKGHDNNGMRYNSYLKYFKENNIIVCNIPKYSTDSVAEYAIFLMMCLAKKFSLQLKKDYKNGIFYSYANH